MEIEWQTYPGGQPNKTFLAELRAQVDKEVAGDVHLPQRSALALGGGSGG